LSEKLTALVTGGAGLIGSHIADLAVARGWNVRVLDNLERQTHREGKPAWVDHDREFMQGDVRNRRDWERALDGVDIVFHQAAYGGYMPEIAKFMHVNSYGTALMLETIRNRDLPVRKIVLASSQAVYSEGKYTCPEHGAFYGSTRSIERLAGADYDVHCPQCDRVATAIPTDEAAPMGGENVYAISKSDQERLVMTFGRATGLPVVALRYSCTYGPRQSLFNPYTGVIAIFCTRLINGLPPVVYEDGRQSRDLIFVEDIARANMLVATNDQANHRVLNVGTGQAAEIGALATLLGGKLGVAIEPHYPGEFRPGEMRSLISDIGKIRELGFEPVTTLSDGIDRYLSWIGEQGDVHEYFSQAERRLRQRQVVKRSAPA
jgi:dTDP-L-rhamnose 4-epimerase